MMLLDKYNYQKYKMHATFCYFINIFHLFKNKEMISILQLSKTMVIIVIIKNNSNI